MSETIVSMENICKSFPGVKALDHVHFELRSGEVMALLGENGAGKSTLMKVLSGVYTRDGGTVRIFGKEYGDMNPKQAQEAGVAIIHQELNMCRHLSVSENMFLGREKVKGMILSNKEMEAEARTILNELKIDLDPHQVVGDLPVSKQQMVEIAKALSTHARILIMDEPTSALTAREIEDLFRIIHNLKEKGCGIVYISHRLEELQSIVDRVTIMRDGQYITTMNFEDTTLDEIISNMVGREIKEKFPRVTCDKGRLVLKVSNLNAGRMVRDVDFSLYEGEIVGFAGLMGAGRTELAMSIFGRSYGQKISGTIKINGREVHIKDVKDAINNKLAYVSEDRKNYGLVLIKDIKWNMTLSAMRNFFSKNGVLNENDEILAAEDYKKKINIKSNSINQTVGSLSGGNQQKVVLAKWMLTQPDVLILDEPTRGIDVGAKYEIYCVINELAKSGKAVIVISSEMQEVIGTCDRVYVINEGRIAGELTKEEVTQERIMKCIMADNGKEA